LIPYRITTREEMLAYIRKALSDQAAGSAIPFATVEKGSSRVVGSTRFLNIDRANSRVEIGSTWLARPWQRTAINTEAKYLMLRYAFEDLACTRVELKTDALNQVSRAAILRIGAKQEGILRKHMATWTGRVRDTVYFSILDSEWRDVKASLEHKLSGSRP
jgi:RimJ/RimL family protein N-acetyltransferase